MAREPHPHQHAAAERQEPGPLTTGAYSLSLLALIVLTLTSYWLSYQHLGAFEMPVALGIAAVKVGVVALFLWAWYTNPRARA